uniref:Uncharacterized protein n=1 Tax=Propithecus coquereli TaxID=379532 RepID=A0A2K6GXH9_PROCO
MSVQDPPRLLQLAGQSLLRDEAVAIPALEELPTELFPPLFMEAFTKSRSKTLMAMVQAWPFTRLPLGALMLTPDLETLRTVLEGLDVLLAQKVRPRCLKTPLESFAITECCLSELEMERLFLCPSTHQLKELDLTGIKLSSFNPEPLQILLENIAATLQVLILEDCWITDYQLSVILPALSRCHQLMTLNFSGNQISKAILENLLGHTVGLSRLSLEIYPVPRECYDDGFKDINQKRFLQLQAGLMEILRDLRQPKRMEFRTLPCSCGER